MIRLSRNANTANFTSWVLSFVAMLCVVGFGTAAAAAAPDVEVREIFDRVIEKLNEKNVDGTLDEQSARAVFTELLSPRIAYESLARWILREHWENASEAQRAAFLAAFQSYIINTYALALANGQDIVLDVAGQSRTEEECRNRACRIRNGRCGPGSAGVSSHHAQRRMDVIRRVIYRGESGADVSLRFQLRRA